MPFSLTELCEKVLFILQQGTAQANMSGGLLTNERIVASINSGYAMMNMMALAKRNQFLLDYFNATVDPSTSLLSRKLNSKNLNILAVTISANGDAPPGVQEQTAVLASWKNGLSYPNQVQYAPRGVGEVLIVRNSVQSNQVFRVWYARPVQPLHSGTLTAGTTTALTFPSTPSLGKLAKFNDAYKGDEVMIVGTGDTARITAYAKSTRTATVANIDEVGVAAFATNPGAVAYSMCPWFPDIHVETLAWLAAELFTRVDTSRDFSPQIQMRLKEYEQWLIAPDVASQTKVGTVIGNDMLGALGPIQGWGYTGGGFG